MSRALRVLVASFWLSTLGARPASAEFFHVEDVAGLTAAVAAAEATAELDGILLQPGTYSLTETLTLLGEIVISGNDPEKTILTTTEPIGLVVVVGGTASFRALTFDGGSATRGGNIDVQNAATVTLEDVRLRNGTASDRGGCLNLQSALSSVSIIASRIEQCNAFAAGAIASAGALTIVRSVVRDNVADFVGGVFAGNGTLEVRESLFENNSSGSDGALQTVTIDAVIRDAVFAGNSGSVSAAASHFGPGTIEITNAIYGENVSTNDNPTVTITQNADAIVNNATLATNDSGFGPDLRVDFGTLEIHNSIVQRISFANPDEQVVASGHNVVASGNLPDDGTTQIEDPLLVGALRPSGGNLPTMVPDPDSAAVEGGSAAMPGEAGACEETDVNGAPRDPELTGDCTTGAKQMTPCSNSVDDDLDGNIDYPADRQCDDVADLSEMPECGNGIDDDANGRIDHAGGDPGCKDENDDSEATADCGDACGLAGIGPLPAVWILLRQRRKRALTPTKEA